MEHRKSIRDLRAGDWVWGARYLLQFVSTFLWTCCATAGLFGRLAAF